MGNPLVCSWQIQIDHHSYPQTRSFTERCSKECQNFFHQIIHSFIRENNGNQKNFKIHILNQCVRLGWKMSEARLREEQFTPMDFLRLCNFIIYLNFVCSNIFSFVYFCLSLVCIFLFLCIICCIHMTLGFWCHLATVARRLLSLCCTWSLLIRFP